jgi:LPXTG-motif cell wall-anchored protein
VSEDDGPGLQREPGQAGGFIDGVPTPVEVRTIDDEAARTAPEDRTPAQVLAIQQAGAALLAEFNEAAPDGSEPLVTLTNTPTGAVVNGILVDPRDGITPVPVPVEDVVLLSFRELSSQQVNVLLAAGSDEGEPSVVAGGLLEVTDGGVVSTVAYGFAPSTAGELVIFSSPQLVGSFTTGTDGSFAGQFTIPAGLAPGEHTLVLIAGNATTSLGLLVAADGSAEIFDPSQPGALPSTGGDVSSVLVLAIALMMLGLLIATRRREPSRI